MPRAPRRCPAPDCTELIRGSQRYCSDHTKHWTGPRTNSSRITSTREWKDTVKPRVLKRAHYRCQIQYPGICTGRATVVDKKDPAAHHPRRALDDDNLQAACAECNDHKARTQDREAP